MRPLLVPMFESLLPSRLTSLGRIREGVVLLEEVCVTGGGFENSKD